MLFYYPISRYLGEEEESKSNGESRSKALLSKLQERAKAREQQSLATKKESDVRDAKTSEPSVVRKTKRKLERQEKEKKQPKKKRKESIEEEQDVDLDADADDASAEQADLTTRKKKGNVSREDKEHSGICVFARVNLPGK